MEFELANNIITVLSSVFIFVLGIALFAILIIYIIDVSQTKQAIRHNFPVIGRFRYRYNIGKMPS